MSNKDQYLKLRRSAVPGKIPTTSSIDFGELAMNTHDGLLFMKKSGSSGEEVIAIGATSSGSFTGSLFGTSSWSINSLSASYYQETDPVFVAKSASLATTGSNVFVGAQIITGSLLTSGSITLFGNTLLTGSLVISGSLQSIPTIKIYGDIQQNGYTRFDPVTTNIDSSISASYIYVSGSTNDLYFSQNSAGYANTTRLRWLEGNLYTGLLNGGIITTQSSTVYQISSGSGIIVSLNASLNNNPYPTVSYINWPNLSASIETLSSSYDQSFVSILSNATIGAQGIPYNDGDYNTKIPIGIVIHQNRSTINAVQTFPGVAYGWKQRSYDFIRAFGPLKISGYTLAPSGSSTGSLVLSGGTAWVDGRNYVVDPNNPSYINEALGISTSKIYRYYQSGSSWVYNTNGGAGYQTIDPTHYSNNGVLTSVSVTNWTIQRVFYFPNSATKALYIYYGNAEYINEAAALAAVSTEPFAEAPNTLANAIYVGFMLLRNNADFTNASTYTFYQAGLFRSSGIGGSGGGGGATALVALTDVSITSPTDYQPLIYNSVTTKWSNASALSASLKGNADTSTTASYASTSSFSFYAISSSYLEGFTPFQITTGSVTASVSVDPTRSFFIKSGSAYIFNVDNKGNTTTSGSLKIETSGTVTEMLSVNNNGTEYLKVNNEGVLVLNTFLNPPTPVSGGLYMDTSGNIYLGT